ncbi:MAG: hypothetical protein ACXVXP_00410 [Mycobacteriaceae bacterium]
MTTHEHDDLQRRVGHLDDRFNDHVLDDEKRFGRIEKLIVFVAVLVLMPKIGGPEASALLTHAVAFLAH